MTPASCGEEVFRKWDAWQFLRVSYHHTRPCHDSQTVSCSPVVSLRDRPPFACIDHLAMSRGYSNTDERGAARYRDVEWKLRSRRTPIVQGVTSRRHFSSVEYMCLPTSRLKPVHQSFSDGTPMCATRDLSIFKDTSDMSARSYIRLTSYIMSYGDHPR